MSKQVLERVPGAERRPVGRPRRLTLEAIVEAACEIGLARLDMGHVARHLNTGVATLYGYVGGREQLLALVAERLTSQALLHDRGQSWPEILHEHAEIAMRLFEAEPHVILRLMITADEREFAYSRQIHAMLMDRGLDHQLAAELIIEVNQLVIGAAVCRTRRSAVAVAAGPDSAIVLDRLGDYRPTLDRVIADYAAILAGRKLPDRQSAT